MHASLIQILAVCGLALPTLLPFGICYSTPTTLRVRLSRLDGRILHVHRELVAFLVRRRIGGDELGAGVQEELFECGKTLLTGSALRTHLTWYQRKTYPRDIFVNCSPYRSFTMLEMLSSTRMGDRALQMARSAYIRSAVLLI